ncbi:MAG TPA: extracellular solute-binding protein [Chloroflexota bacterium]|nr:extracellular solute-binding protein [Chloroflexota bacterium]
MRDMRGLAAALLCALPLLAAPPAARADEPVTLDVFAAGTLAVPFREIGALFQQKYPNVTVHAQFGGSVKMAKQITELHQTADLLAVADYNVIPKYLFGEPGYATWYAGFARNAVTFVYTDTSQYAGEVSSTNWYQILARKGVEIGRSNPDTDPSGYQTVQMLSLAESYYAVPGLAKSVLANAPETNMRDTETALISALQIGQIDYLAIYKSDALQHHLKFLDLPAAIDLSDPTFSARYAKAIARTKNGDLPGRPIVYALTIPSNAEHGEWAEKYAAFLLGPDGQAVMRKDGFGSFAPAYAVNPDRVPTSLSSYVKPWPQS